MVLGLNQFYGVFYDFLLNFKVFINIHEYADTIICISGHDI